MRHCKRLRDGGLSMKSSASHPQTYSEAFEDGLSSGIIPNSDRDLLLLLAPRTEERPRLGRILLALRVAAPEATTSKSSCSASSALPVACCGTTVRYCESQCDCNYRLALTQRSTMRRLQTCCNCTCTGGTLQRERSCIARTRIWPCTTFWVCTCCPSCSTRIA